MIHLADVFLWWFAVGITGLFALPIAGIVTGRLHDRGYSISKILALVLVTYLTWVLSYLFTFNWFTVLLSVLVLALVSAAAQKRYSLPRPEKRTVFMNELIFMSAFLFFMIVRSADPQIYGQEKFMDLAFLNGILQSTGFPPLDPWFAGGTLDFYYYFGYLAVAVLTKLTGVVPSVAFNLAVALIFALTLNISYGIGYNLTGSTRYGAVAAIFTTMLGNVQGAIQFVSSYILHLPSTTPYYWSSSRVIPHTINEFPYFSFIHGDLHAHMLAIPLQLLMISLLLNLYLSKKGGFGVFGNTVGFTVFALCLGFLFPANTWDYPTYLAITFAVLAAVQYRERSSWGSGWAVDLVKTGGAAAAVSLLLYLPFHLSFSPGGVSGIGFVAAHARTEILPFLILFGLFLFLLYSLLLQDQKTGNKQPVMYFVGILVLAVVSWLLSFPLLLILLPLLALSAGTFSRERCNRAPLGFIAILCAAGTVLSILCEVVYIRDAYQSPLERMNTVFKFYLQVWLMWSIAAFYAYYHLISHNGAAWHGDNRQKLWAGVLVILIAACAVFPVAATLARTGDFAANPALDGMEYMKDKNIGDYYAIQWLSNISGAPVILEAPGRSYSFGSRVSANTGLPTVTGWVNHELVWRGDPGTIKERCRDVRTIYETNDIDEAAQLLEKYNISYVYVGDLEREMYSSRGLDKFEDTGFFECVYLDSVTIYRIR